MSAHNAPEVGVVTPPDPEPQPTQDDPLLESLALLTRLHGRPLSPAALAAGLPLVDGRLTPGLLVRAADRQGWSARVVKRRLTRISNLVLPAILLTTQGGACVLTRLHADGSAEVALPEAGIGVKTVPVSELSEEYSGYAIFAQPMPRPDPRVDDLPQHQASWFWGTLWRFKRYYGEAIAVTAIVNLLTVATSLFVMNVYDRVVPNKAIDTLIVLAIGTAIAIGLEFLGRNLRNYFIDAAGKKADLLLAEQLFRQALGLRMEARPNSSGSFAAQLREFETLRDFFSSATLTSFSDLPFIVFFVWVIYLVGGPLYLVPLVAVPLVLVVGLLAQIPLARLMKRHVRESALKHGVLVEAVEGMETIKTLCAEGVIQGRYENYVALTADSATKSRGVSALVVNFAQFVAQLVTVSMVVWGAFLIGDGELTMGALIACVILSGRGLAPIGQIASLLVRYQHARCSYHVLDGLMKSPVERPPERAFLHRPTVQGAIELRDVTFAYPGEKTPVLQQVSLRITAGERVGIVGRVGSGKSTLLKLLVGLYAPLEGSILVDGTDLEQFDPADLRRNIGYLSQEVRLFQGSLRENIALGVPQADDEAVLEAARVACLEGLVSGHPMGFERMVHEGGHGLSGGQRQALGIARTVLARPRVVLMDEPTSAMDHSTEHLLLGRVRPFLEGRTVLLVTHKPSMLELVNRLIVLEGGRVIADGPRDAVLKALTQGAG